MGGLLKKRKALLVVLIVILAAAGIFAAVYFISPAKSARDFYLKAEGRSFKLYADRIKKSYKDFAESRQPYFDADYKRRVELTAEVSSKDGKPFGIENAEGIFDIIKRCKLIVDTNRSPAGGKSLSEISLLLEKTPFADAEIFRDNRQLYFTVPVLTPNRYFTLDIDKINEVYDRFGIPVKPQRIVNSEEVAKTVKFDSEQFDKSTAELGNFISGLIGDGDVAYGRNTELTLAGEKVAGREVTVKLDGKKSRELIRGLARRYTDDKSLLGLTYGNAADLSELLDQAGLFRLFEYLDKTGAMVLSDSEKKLVTALNFKNDAGGFAKQLTDAINSLDFPQGIDMKLIIDKAGSILDRTLEVPVADTRSNKNYKIGIHTGCSSLLADDCRNRFAEVSAENADASGKTSRSVFKLDAAFAPSGKNGDEKGNFGVAWSTELDGALRSSADMKLDLSSSTDMATLKRKDICKYTLEMKYAGVDGSNVLSGEADTESWNNKKLKTKDWSTSITLKAVMPSFGVKDFSAALRLAKEDRLGIEPFELPAVNAAGTVNLNTASKEELDRVWNEILASFGVFYMTNKPIIDAVLGK